MKTIFFALVILLVGASPSTSSAVLIQLTDKIKLNLEQNETGDYQTTGGVIDRFGIAILAPYGSRNWTQKLEVNAGVYDMKISLTRNEVVAETKTGVTVSSIIVDPKKNTFLIKAQDLTGLSGGIDEGTTNNIYAKVVHSDFKCTVLGSKILCFGTQDSFVGGQ